MKVLIHIPQLIYGGAEKVLVNFANYLVEKGHEVEVLETYEKGLLKPQFDNRVTFNAICSKAYTSKYYASLDDIKHEKNIIKIVMKLMKLCFSKIVGYRRFAEQLAAKNYKGKKYDVAINYLEIESPQFVLNNIKADKYMQWIHTDIQKLAPGELDAFAFFYNSMDNIICVSETAKETFCNIYPQLREKTHVIYNFYDTNLIKQRADEKIELKKDKIIILSVGRICAEKAYPRAIEVINKLISEGYDFKWYIIGDGGERQKIKNKIKEYKLENYIELLGLKDNPYPYIKNCDLFFLPSLYEGFPTVTIEAKVLHKPVLSTEVSGIREQIKNGKQGMIVENSEEGIYYGLKKLFDNPELLCELADNSDMANVLDNEIKYNKLIELGKDIN